MFGEEEQEAGDLARAILARARSKIAVGLADEAYRGALWSVLRTELGESVTRVSGFVLALLENEDLLLDDLAWMIEPARGWPNQMHHSGLGAVRTGRLTRLVRRDFHRSGAGLLHHGLSFHVRDGGNLRLHVIGNSLEIIGRVDGVGLRTRYGMLRLTLPGAFPASLVHSCVGSPAAAVVDLPPLIGRDWPVIGLEPAAASGKWVVIVRTGSIPYTMPWVR